MAIPDPEMDPTNGGITKTIRLKVKSCWVTLPLPTSYSPCPSLILEPDDPWSVCVFFLFKSSVAITGISHISLWNILLVIFVFPHLLLQLGLGEVLAELRKALLSVLLPPKRHVATLVVKLQSMSTPLNIRIKFTRT